jgi:hypothetical protein
MLENLLICYLIVVGAFALLVLLNWLGLGIMRIRDRETNRKRLCVVRRER